MCHHLFPKYRAIKRVFKSLEDVQIFLEDCGCFEQASTASSLLAQMATQHSSTLMQSILDHFFEPTQ